MTISFSSLRMANSSLGSKWFRGFFALLRPCCMYEGGEDDNEQGESRAKVRIIKADEILLLLPRPKRNLAIHGTTEVLFD